MKKLKIDTSLGTYNPDWTVLLNKKGELILFMTRRMIYGERSIPRVEDCRRHADVY